MIEDTKEGYQFTGIDLVELERIFNEILLPMLPELGLPLASKRQRCALIQAAHRIMQFTLNDASLRANIKYGDRDFFVNDGIDFSEGLGEAPIAADTFSQAMDAAYPIQRPAIMQELNTVIAAQITNFLNSDEFADLNYAFSIVDRDIPQFANGQHLQEDETDRVYRSPNHAANNYRVNRMFALPIELDLKNILEKIANIIDDEVEIKELLELMIYEDKSWLENRVEANHRKLLEKTRTIRWGNDWSIMVCFVLIIAFYPLMRYVNRDILSGFASLCLVALTIYHSCRPRMIRAVAQEMQVANEFIETFSGSFATPGYQQLSDDEKESLLNWLTQRVQTILQLVRERGQLMTQYYPSAAN